MEIDDRAKPYVGLEIGQACLLAESQGVNYRIASDDGVSFMVTSDYIVTRINFHVVDAKVVNVTFG
jgi:hypothetical protein